MSATPSYADGSFRLDVEPERDIVRVCPRGEVDLATAATIREEIEELTAMGFARVALDLRGVTFLDSTGLRLSLELTMAARAEGWEFALIEGPADVQRVFEVAGVRPLVLFIEPSQIRYARWEATWR
jgi:anti-sigma B factor antagonist